MKFYKGEELEGKKEVAATNFDYCCRRKLEVAHQGSNSSNDKRYLNGPRLNRSMSIT